MKVPAPIKVYEQSPNVATLHAAIRLLGQRVDLEELREQRAGNSTIKLVRELQRRMNIPVHETFLVDEATAAVINRLLEQQGVGGNTLPTAPGDDEEGRYSVSGVVIGPDRRPARGLTVTAFDQDLRTRQELGTATTGGRGEYRVLYSSELFARAEKGNADLVMVVSMPGAEILHTTDVLFHAPRHALIDIELPSFGQEAELDRVLRLVTPLGEGQGVSFDGLEENEKHRDLTFLANETGLRVDLLTQFAVAFRLMTRSKIAAPFWYAALRTQTLIPTTLSSDRPPTIAEIAENAWSRITATPAEAMERGVRRAIDLAIIDSRHAAGVEAWLKTYRALIRREASEETKPGSARDVIEASNIDPDKRGRVLDAFLQGGSRRQIVERLRKDERLDAKEVGTLEAAMILNDLTLGDPALLRRLRRDVDRPERVPDLARMDTAEWQELVASSGTPDYVAGNTDIDKQRNYATLLTKRFQREYPTAAFAGGLARALESSEKPVLEQAPAIVRFLEKHADFELDTMSIEGYLDSQSGTELLRGQSAAERTAFVRDLKAAQRVFKVAPTYAATDTLLRDGVHSARSIYRMGKTKFVGKYRDQPGFDEKSARETFDRAANTQAALATMVGDLASTSSSNDFAALSVQLTDFPNLANLFGAADVCECDDCRSIFSPAAYFADLMMYLEARDSIAAGVSVKDVLFQRRPDLPYLELSCENSHTPLPYIDLACEVLEDHVAPWKLFDLALALEPQFVEGPVSAVLSAAFAAATPPITLSSGAKVSAKDDLDSWVVRDGEQSWRVAKTASALVVSLLRQTRGTAEELAAAPEYVNQAAYTELRKAKYPMSLPFDLSTEEVRAFLDRAGVKRADLMEIFRGANPPNDPSADDIAAEALGIADYEAGILFDSEPVNQFEFWGELTNPAAIAEAVKVNVFLNRTRLEYADLQRMLSLQFLNPGGTIQIQHLDSSCDTAQKRLQPLDEHALDRFHRFLRLWRKLGWKMWEVDLVINVLGGGNLDLQLARRLRPFLKLLKRFPKLTVEQLASFFGNVNTRASFTTAFKRTEPSLYERLFLNKRIINPLDPAFEVPALSGAETLDAHLPPIFAAMRLSATDLATLRTLTLPSGITPAIDNKLTLANLSFLYRHAVLAKQMRIKISDWVRMIFLLQRNIYEGPAKTLEFVELYDRIQSSGLSIDQLSYILSANLIAKSADSERNAATMLTALRKALQTIVTENDPSTLPTSVDELSTTIAAKLQVVGWPVEDAQAVVAALTDTIQLRAVAPTMPAGFTFPASITSQMTISYDDTAKAISFSGFMTDTQQITLLTHGDLGTVTANVDYQNVINEIHATPRLLIKFYEPFFRTPLAGLPSSVSFATQLSPQLAAKIAYDAERAELTFFGVMTKGERDALNGLSADIAYRNAVLALFTLPRSGVFPADQFWLTTAALAFPLADDDPALDNRPANLNEAAKRLLDYLTRTGSRETVVQQFATAVRVSPAIAERLLTTFQLFAQPLLEDYTDPAFVASAGALTYATDQQKFDGYYWMHRVGLPLRQLRVTFSDLDWIIRTHTQTQVLDLATLPIVFSPNPPQVASIDRLLDLADYMQLHHTRSDEDASLLAMVDRLITDPGYTAALFAADVELLTEWPADDVEALVNALDVAYPAGYRVFAGWQRLVKAFAILTKLNGAAADVLKLAGTAVDAAMAATVKQLLRAKFEEEQWLELSKIVQNALRERKRDSLVAYLLTRPMPADAPTNKWENANDLFACYLIDVEMSACQLSSRIVQASAAAQLFVQRCFMGLEPKVRVSVENDDGWLQWQWMKQYRVWEANRRVFAFPENYTEPELRRDKSEIFKDLEDELLQNDVNRDNVETAFLHYLQHLDDIAHLEVAGTYYQESTHTMHVFARTAGSEPRTYYYRQFVDHRRWTPWSKVEIDIKSDYLVPLVANERLHLVWPEFRELPQSPTTTNVPNQGDLVTMDKPVKRMNVHLAVSELRSGKWTPKKVSQEPVDTASYTEEFDRSPYAIYPIDLTWLGPEGPFLLLVHNTDHNISHHLFELAGCRGYPERYRPGGYIAFYPLITRFDRDDLRFLKNEESWQGDDLVPRQNQFMVEEILNLTPGFFRVAYPHYMSYFDRLTFFFIFAGLFLGAVTHGERIIPIRLGTFYDWFYLDKLRTFFVRQEWLSAANGSRLFYRQVSELFQEIFDLIVAQKWPELAQRVREAAEAKYEFRLLFSTFYHPLTCHLTKQLYSGGVERLMERKTQFADKNLQFPVRYAPTSVVDPKYPQELIDFDPDGSYSQYNWELFFHAPLMIATRLSKEQRFEDAMRWFHFIFDPTGGSDRDPITNLPAPAPQKYWITKPFYLRQSADYLNQRIENLMHLLASPATPADAALKAELENQVMDWRRNPFDPHLVAQFRTVAYQKLTVMKYVDNLIAWGDQRFRMDTMESINEATQLYVLAAEILGQRPRRVPPAAKPPAKTFSELEKDLDAFSNALVEFENVVPPLPPENGAPGPVPDVPTLLYFCIPPNDQMLRYWDTVADRLYKIRHCMNIEGVVRQLSLFAPPIDPAALVRAVAAGVDIGTALADLDAPLPHYRFTTMLQKANELVNDLKSLGAALLGALEKKDAEAVARLRQGQEIAVLKAARDVKERQIEDNQLVIDGLQKQKELIAIRRDFYAGREFMNAGEIAAATLSAASLVAHFAGTVADVLAGVMFIIPDFKIGASGFGGSPHFALEPPVGSKAGNASGRGANGLYNVATILEKSAGMASIIAGHQRRADEWQNSVALANKELEQLEKQLASAELRKAIAEKELQNHDLQIENSKAVDAFMRDKYTNQELYQWMSGQISQTFFQTYKLAYDVAKRAERCYRYEIGVQDSGFIQFGYWDSLKSGLMSGEKLQLDLRRLENAYLDQNRRELECTKHVSLAMINPRALLTLKETGVCFVDLPEELFDFDYPGHYFRRIKTVSISVPCVAGPHTTITCTLRLLKNSVRINTSLVPQYEHNHDEGVLTDDDRFRESHVRAKAIATSSGQNDSGMFELSFRDERYLPFEGAGAISTWQVELTQEPALRQFSYDSISDVILHVKYTAREDAGQFRNAAVAYMKTVLDDAAGRMPLRRLFDLQREFPTEWYAFLHPTGTPDKILHLNVRKQHFPYFAQDGDIEITAVMLFVRSDSTEALVATLDPPTSPASINLTTTGSADELHIGSKTSLAETLDETQPWQLRLRKDSGTFNGITPAELEEAFLVVEYVTS
ncbi:MAG TPA: neuraminidase-like domain-containing protein [Thermoanaerobaculia bacterium]|nr:neuraminidase-like domain-containing protein [Thermoanaerobaculia bacterium]